MLPTHMQRFAAGHEQVEPWASIQQLRRHGRRSRHLLEVVEDEQHTLFPQPSIELVEHGLVARVAYVDRARDGRENRSAVATCGKVDEEHAILELVDLVGGSAERQPRLS